MNRWEEIATALIAPVGFLSSPDKRVFWPCLMSAAILAGLVYWKSTRRPESLTRFLFAKEIWWSKSTKLDYQLAITNGCIRLFVNASTLLPMAAVAALVSTLLDWTKAPPDLDLSRTTITASYTIALFVVGDLSRYLLHRLLHRVPFLWAFHQTHHSATGLNPFTVYRVHPVESFLYGLRGALATGLTTGIFIWLFGTSLSAYDVLGVNALGLAFNLMGANLRHSHVWLSYGPLEQLVISPAQHQIHHSAAAQHANTNFGTCLSLWDKMAGSWMQAGPARRLEFGLAESNDTPTHGLVASLIAPLNPLIRKYWHRQTLP